MGPGFSILQGFVALYLVAIGSVDCNRLIRFNFIYEHRNYTGDL